MAFRTTSIAWRWLLFGWLMGLSLPSAAGQDRQAAFGNAAQRADEARQQNRLLDSIRYYGEAVRLKPDWVEGWWYIATAYYELDFFTDAARALNQVVSVNPTAVEAWSLLGLCEYSIGEYDAALLSLERAVDLGVGVQNRFALPVRYRLAMLLNRKQRFEEAGRILGEIAAAGHYGEPVIRETLGISALRLSYLPKELPAEHRQAVLIAGRAMGYISYNLPDGAKYELERLARLFPKMPNVHYIYGSYLAQTEPDRALDEYKKELEISPDHLPALVEITLEYLTRDSPREALPYAERALRLDVESFPVRYALGQVYLELGRTDEAIQQLEKGVILAPDSPDLYFALSRAYEGAGQSEQAAKAREEFQRLKVSP